MVEVTFTEVSFHPASIQANSNSINTKPVKSHALPIDIWPRPLFLVRHKDSSRGLMDVVAPTGQLADTLAGCFQIAQNWEGAGP